jgi:formate dehydrogenase subunit delta
LTSDKLDKLVRMANQIGDFYAALPEAQGAESFASHLRLYWTPKMIRELVEYSAEGQAHLNPTAARGLLTMKQTATAS